jgi:hypothetical protein
MVFEVIKKVNCKLPAGNKVCEQCCGQKPLKCDITYIVLLQKVTPMFLDCCFKTSFKLK